MEDFFKKYNCFIPPLIWVTLIFVLCSISANNLPKVEGLFKELFDKIVHFSLYLVLSLLLTVSFLKQTFSNSLRRSSVYYALIFSIVYGILIELFQMTILHGRTGDVQDVIANTIGAIFGLWAFRFIYGKPKQYF